MERTKKVERINNDIRIKKRKLLSRHGFLTYTIMLLLVGIQVGIIVFPGFQLLDERLQIIIIMSYWAIITAIYIWVTNKQLKTEYEEPMQKLSIATHQVANGDFSIYVEPRNTSDKYDYIDVMFMDFNKMVEELGSIETLKNDFVSSVSHELKTPLAIIKNYSTNLKNGNLSATTQKEYIETIITATDRLSNLITNILRLNKLENQVINTIPKPYNISNQIVECILQFETFWEEKEIELIIDVEEDATITSDKNLLEIVWNNLISNAIKFTEHGGVVIVTQKSDANSVTVTVADSGCGMSTKIVRHIFDKFYQADTSRAQQGNGLGLALVKRIIDKIDGAITVESELGKGSTFTVRLDKNSQYDDKSGVHAKE